MVEGSTPNPMAEQKHMMRKRWYELWWCDKSHGLLVQHVASAASSDAWWDVAHIRKMLSQIHLWENLCLDYWSWPHITFILKCHLIINESDEYGKCKVNGLISILLSLEVIWQLPVLTIAVYKWGNPEEYLPINRFFAPTCSCYISIQKGLNSKRKVGD